MSWYADDPKAASGRAYFDSDSSSYESGRRYRAGVWSVAVAKKSDWW